VKTLLIETCPERILDMTSLQLNQILNLKVYIYQCLALSSLDLQCLFFVSC